MDIGLSLLGFAITLIGFLGYGIIKEIRKTQKKVDACMQAILNLKYR